MKQALDIIARIISIVCYPLFIPTYGMALFCYAYSVQVHALPMVWTIVATTGTLVLTCILPLSAIGILMLKGKVKDIQIENARERTAPYLYATAGFGFWSYLVTAILQAPLPIKMVSIGATAAIGTVMIINRWWKISAHMTGIGGLIGGWVSYYISIGMVPSWSTIGVWMTGSLVVMYARLRLNAHTGAQVAAGWLLGTACTCVPYCIMTYAA